MAREHMAFHLSVSGRLDPNSVNWEPDERNNHYNILGIHPESLIEKGGGYEKLVVGKNGTTYNVSIEVREVQASHQGYYKTKG